MLEATRFACQRQKPRTRRTKGHTFAQIWRRWFPRAHIRSCDPTRPEVAAARPCQAKSMSGLRAIAHAVRGVAARAPKAGAAFHSKRAAAPAGAVAAAHARGACRCAVCACARVPARGLASKPEKVCPAPRPLAPGPALPHRGARSRRARAVPGKLWVHLRGEQPAVLHRAAKPRGLWPLPWCVHRAHLLAPVRPLVRRVRSGGDSAGRAWHRASARACRLTVTHVADTRQIATKS